MPKMFMSYRRNDSADATGRLHDRLKAHFGEEAVFYDVHSILLGVDFRKYINDEVGKCDVLLAVIGETWVNAADNGKRRLDNPNDLVRIEIETALARDIPVIPVLVANASMPTEADLPGDLKGLAVRNAAFVRPGADFDDHAQRLIHGLERLFTLKADIDGRVQKANRLADDDPEIALTPSRTALEIVIREMYERRIGEPPGSRSLEQLSQCLIERGAFPASIDLSSIVERLERSRSSTKKLTKAESSGLLAEVMVVIKWYMTVEQPDKMGQNLSLTAISQSGPVKVGQGASASPIAIVPKGLSSFDANDADFFLELLPGPRDKYGIPQSIRFWKHRIEERDEATFTVGVIYGPSGCGKSSLVKAGLLPRLADHVVSVYIEASADETEICLLNGLRRRCPDLSKDLDLTGTIMDLRQGDGLQQGQKVLIVLDQFEQWLHAKSGKRTSKLVQALRQCDGERVQAIVMVRDDFCLAVNRFLDQLHIKLLEGQNLALVDLFDVRHAKNVLAAFGRAFGRVSEPASNEQEAFLENAVNGLAQDERVISVRLALIAEMFKGRIWTSIDLKKVGGTEGIGVAFLEETFSSTGANFKNRLHQTAARCILNALLPEQGTDIKGNMRSHANLLEASGYSKRPTDFEELLRILDTELRLITPTNLEESATQADGKYYQLTHDYLVPSLRDWLTRKLKETRRGRAELLLADRAAVWNARPENRQLPSLVQWFQIQWLTQKKNWTPPQRKMMSKAGRVYGTWATAVAVLFLMATITGLAIRAQAIEEKKQVAERQKATKADGLVRTVLKADIVQVPTIIIEMTDYRKWIDPLLREEIEKAETNSSQKLNASIALLPVDSSHVEYLYGRLLDAKPNEVPIIRDALTTHKDGLLDKLWSVVEAPEKGKESQRLRAASALAKYDPENERWKNVQESVGNELVNVPTVYLASWMESLRPMREKMIPALSQVFRTVSRKEVERSLAADILADYAADQPQALAELVMDANEIQFAVIFPKLKDRAPQALPLLIGEIEQKLPDDMPSSDESREKLAKRQANAAIALLRLDQPEKVWPLLKHSPDPRVRSYVIHRLAPLGVDPTMIIKRLDAETDITKFRALVMSLGEFNEQALSPEQRTTLIPKLQAMYRTHSDPGLHGAAEWLLRQWKQEEWLKQANDELKTEPRLANIEKQLAKPTVSAAHSPQWYVNSQGQTLLIIPGPVEFVMGSPEKEAGHQDDEKQHKRRIARTFAVANKAVTLGQYQEFDGEYKLAEAYSHRPDLPVIGTSWFQATVYCNWLSRQEELPECYEITGEPDENGNRATKLKENYLSLGGYRLPTEAEMEYMTRAEATTSRYFGETEELLRRYAWYDKNSEEKLQPVGHRKPNDFGLFDGQGNCYTWCQEAYVAYSMPEGETTVEDQETPMLNVSSTKSRVLRGGTFLTRSSGVRSASRNINPPSSRFIYSGFRLARTLPLVPLTSLPTAPEGGEIEKPDK